MQTRLHACMPHTHTLSQAHTIHNTHQKKSKTQEHTDADAQAHLFITEGYVTAVAWVPGQSGNCQTPLMSTPAMQTISLSKSTLKAIHVQCVSFDSNTILFK